MLSLILNPESYRLNFLAVAAFSTTFLLLVLGFTVLVREQYSRVGRAFFLMTIPLAIWLAAFGCVYGSLTPDGALFWSRAAYLGVPFIPVGFVHFYLLVLGRERLRRRAARWTALISTVFAVGFVTWPDLIRDTYHYSWGYFPHHRLAGALFVAYFVSVLVFVLRTVWTGYREVATLRQKARLRALLIGLVLAYIGAIDYLPKFGFNVYPLGFLPILAFLAANAHAVWKFRLVDITPSFAANKILETMEGAVFVTDIYGTIRVVNGMAAELFAVPEHELIGRTLAAKGLRFVPRGQQEPPSVPYRQSESMLRRADGGCIEVDVSASWLTDSAGLRVGIVYVASDVSNKVREAQRLIQRETELARKSAENEQLELLTAVLAHDLQSPMNHIGAFSDLALRSLDRKDTDEAGAFLIRVKTAHRRLQSMLDGMLRYQTTIMDSEDREPVDLNVVLRDVTGVLHETSEVTFRVDATTLPTVVGYRLQLRQLFDNLLSNAIKYRAPDRPPTVAIDWSKSDNEVLITFRDNGIGFPQSDAEKIFQPFARLTRTTTSQGHGLGLTICRRIVTNHHGRIYANSRAGEGAELVVALPVSVCAELPPAA